MTPMTMLRPSIAALADASTVRVTTPRPRPAFLTDQTPLRVQLQLGEGSVCISLSTPVPPWFLPTVRSFKKVADLSDGWDGYGAPPPAPGAVVAALRTLGRILGEQDPPPEVVPMSSGSVQMEWHQGEIELEIIAYPTGEISASFEDLQTGDEWEIPNVSDHELPKVAAAVAQL